MSISQDINNYLFIDEKKELKDEAREKRLKVKRAYPTKNEARVLIKRDNKQFIITRNKKTIAKFLIFEEAQKFVDQLNPEKLLCQE